MARHSVQGSIFALKKSLCYLKKKVFHALHGNNLATAVNNHMVPYGKVVICKNWHLCPLNIGLKENCQVQAGQKCAPL
jgi:hypothetical protein